MKTKNKGSLEQIYSTTKSLQTTLKELSRYINSALKIVNTLPNQLHITNIVNKASSHLAEGEIQYIKQYFLETLKILKEVEISIKSNVNKTQINRLAELEKDLNKINNKIIQLLNSQNIQESNHQQFLSELETSHEICKIIFKAIALKESISKLQGESPYKLIRESKFQIFVVASFAVTLVGLLWGDNLISRLPLHKSKPNFKNLVSEINKMTLDTPQYAISILTLSSNKINDQVSSTILDSIHFAGIHYCRIIKSPTLNQISFNINQNTPQNELEYNHLVIYGFLDSSIAHNFANNELLYNFINSFTKDFNSIKLNYPFRVIEFLPNDTSTYVILNKDINYSTYNISGVQNEKKLLNEINDDLNLHMTTNKSADYNLNFACDTVSNNYYRVNDKIYYSGGSVVMKINGLEYYKFGHIPSTNILGLTEMEFKNYTSDKTNLIVNMYIDSIVIQLKSFLNEN